MIRRIKPICRAVRIEGEIQRIMDEVFSERQELLSLREAWMPCVDIYEMENEIVIETELAGVSQKDILISLQTNRIEIKGAKRENLSSSQIKYLRLEREYGKFHRTITLPCAVYTEKAKALLENGILTLILKKLKKKKEKEVLVKIQKGPD